MSQEHRLHSTYVDALVRLQPYWGHEARNHLQAIKLRLDVLVAQMAAEGGTTVEIRQLTPVIDGALDRIRRFERDVSVQFGGWKPPSGSDGRLDLSAHLRWIERLLAPGARALKVEYSVNAPEAPVWIEDGEPRLAEAVTIAAVEMMLLTRPERGLVIGLESGAGGTGLHIHGVLPDEDSDWLGVVRETFANHGGRIECDGALEFTLPSVPVPRS